MGEEFDLIVITKNYALAGFRLLSTVKKKPVLLQFWLISRENDLAFSLLLIYYIAF